MSVVGMALLSAKGGDSGLSYASILFLESLNKIGIFVYNI
jgi:hypothetical protein